MEPGHAPRPDMRPHAQHHPLRYRRLEPMRTSHAMADSAAAAAKRAASEAAEKKKEEKEKDDDEAEEEEPGLKEMEDVEYEDAYVSERPPMTFQLKEDSERDEFM